MNSKEQKSFQVSTAVLTILERDGFKGVTHAAVSRESGVSRAWIYQYYAKEKANLISSAADMFAKFFSRTDLSWKIPKTQSELLERYRDSFLFVLDVASKHPSIIKLYFRFRGASNSIGTIIKKYENFWLEFSVKAITSSKKITKEEAWHLSNAILVLRLGLAHQVATATVKKETILAATNSIDLILNKFFGT